MRLSLCLKDLFTFNFSLEPNNIPFFCRYVIQFSRYTCHTNWLSTWWSKIFKKNEYTPSDLCKRGAFLLPYFPYFNPLWIDPLGLTRIQTHRAINWIQFFSARKIKKVLLFVWQIMQWGGNFFFFSQPASLLLA